VTEIGWYRLSMLHRSTTSTLSYVTLLLVQLVRLDSDGIWWQCLEFCKQDIVANSPGVI